MNPILYAFLSDNFKKSFLKACTCAAGKDLNSQLQMENSFFPRFGKRGASEKRGGGAAGAGDVAAAGGKQRRVAAAAAEGGDLLAAVEMRSVQFSGCGGAGIESYQIEGGDNVTSESMQTKSTATSIYKGDMMMVMSHHRLSEGFSCSSGGEQQRPPVLHTDL